ncbi:MAG: tetratricopeptide repeat protein [Acidobacteriia bacterium]|nr:tetratricopeptide repeat protein [Terriglobia bacterium]
MLSRLLFWVGLSLMIGPTDNSAVQNPFLNRQQTDTNPIVADADGIVGRSFVAPIISASRFAMADRLSLGINHPQVGSKTDEFLIAQASHRAPLGPMGIPGLRQSSDIGFENLPITRRNPGPHATNTGILFVQAIPKEAESQYKKAIDLLKREKNDEAIRLFHQALDIFPNYYLALQALGAVEVRQGQFETAMKILSRAIEINPKSDVSFVSLGIAQLNLNRMEECIASLRQSTALNPRSPSAYLILGYALIKNGRAPEAEDPLQLAFRFGGDRAIESQLYLANAYEKNGKFQDAANALQVYLKHAPKGADKRTIETMIEKLETKSADSKK